MMPIQRYSQKLKTIPFYRGRLYFIRRVEAEELQNCTINNSLPLVRVNRLSSRTYVSMTLACSRIDTQYQKAIIIQVIS